MSNTIKRDIEELVLAYVESGKEIDVEEWTSKIVDAKKELEFREKTVKRQKVDYTRSVLHSIFRKLKPDGYIVRSIRKNIYRALKPDELPKEHERAMKQLITCAQLVIDLRRLCITHEVGYQADLVIEGGIPGGIEDPIHLANAALESSAQSAKAVGH